MEPTQPAGEIAGTNPGPPSASESGTGLPLLRTWRRVYIFVLGSFVLWVVLLSALARLFA